MELQTVLNADGAATGRVVPRGAALAEGEFVLCVGVWVVDPAGGILLTRRSAEKSFAPGLWENTGGHVQAGETPEKAVLRELFEETGLSAEGTRLHYLGRSRFGCRLGENFGLRMAVDLSRIRLQPGETDAAKLVTRAAFEDMEKSGALASSVTENLKWYRESFLRFLQGEEGERV